MPRWLTRAVSVLLVGVLVMITTAPATANAVLESRLAQAEPAGPARIFYTGWKTAYNDTYVDDFKKLKPQDWFKVACSVKVSWAVTESITSPETASNSTIRFRNGACFSPLGEVWGLKGIKTHELRVTGKDPQGGACMFIGPARLDADTTIPIPGLNGFSGEKGGFEGEAQQFGLQDAPCTPLRWSLRVSWEKSFAPDGNVYYSGDMPELTKPVITPIPEPEGPSTGQCTYGTPTGTKLTQGFSGVDMYQRRVDVTFSPGAVGKWGFRALLRNNRTNNLEYVALQDGVVRTGQTQLTAQSGIGDTVTLIGVQVYRSPDAAFGMTYGMTATPGNSRFRATNPIMLRGQTRGFDGFTEYGPGLTHAESCTFWIGDKATAWDGVPLPPGLSAEPWVDKPVEPPAPDPALTEPPAPPAPDVPDENPCTFDVTDPSSWVSGSLCAIAGLLGALLQLLRDLPMAILNAIGSVFVPRDGALEAQATSLKNSWANSSIGGFFTDVASVPAAFNPTSGGCKGPKFAIKWQDVDVESYPMDACSGAGQTVATVAKAAITLGVTFATFYAILNLIGSAFGLNLNGMGRTAD